MTLKKAITLQLALLLSTPATPVREEPRDWVQKRWQEISVSAWRRILRESIQGGDQRREKFARYMLGGVLNDPEYKGPWEDPGLKGKND